jgi:hypothetical protein
MEDKRTRIVKEWRESTEDAIKALQSWADSLEEWESNGGLADHPDDFLANYQPIFANGLDDWAGENPCDLDLLAAAVRGEELPEPDDRDLIERIFGEA